jgi:putative ABC transport system permease protein
MIALVLRRLRRDLGQQLTILVLVTLASVLVVAAPALIVERIDDGAREAVAVAGARADVVVKTDVADPTESYSPVSTPDDVLEIAENALDNLPPALTAVARDATPAVVSPPLDALEPPPGFDDLSVRVGMLVPTVEKRLELVEGRLPGDSGVEVVITQATAEATGFTVGSRIQLVPPEIVLEVVGIVKPTGDQVADAWPWQDLPTVLEPTRPSSSTGRVGLDMMALTSPAGIVAAQQPFAQAWNGTVRIRLDPSAFTSALQADVIAELSGLEREASEVVGQTYVTARVTSGFTQALATFSAQARAALAQSSLMVTGAFGVAVIALVLVSRLLVARRSRELGLERARGASLASIGLRTITESSVIAVVGGVAGVLLAARGISLLVVGLVVAAALAPAVQSVLVARAQWSGRRVPANRADREALARARGVRRLVLEALVIAIAVGAVVAARSRGLLQTRSDGVDPLLTSAPLFVAAAIAVIVLRVFPVVLRSVSGLAARSRGALGIIGASQARSSVAGLPVLALTIALALGISGGLLLDTVRTGQVDASWERVGADARIDARTSPADAATFAAQPGVEAASSLYVRSGTELTSGAERTIATMVAVDSNYEGVAALLPKAADTAPLALLASADGPLPVLLDETVTKRIASETLSLRIGTQVVDVRVVGTYEDVPDGWVDGPFFFVDYDSLLARLDDPVAATNILVVGPGAARAVDGVEGAVTRASWIDERRGLALIAGVNQLMAVSTAAIALFALVALIASVVAGSRARARSLALLRTLGLRARLGWWLVLAELGPVVAAALVGGALAAATVSLVLGPVLGLSALAGSTSTPASSLSPFVFAAGAGAALILLALATLVEYLAHRRDRLGDVLRVGDTQ